MQSFKKYIYGIENRNNMKRIHNYEVNYIAKHNSLHDIFNSQKNTKLLNIHYSTILHGCMSIRRSRETFRNFWILLYSGCICNECNGKASWSNISWKDAMMQLYTQSGNITTILKVKVSFTLPALSATNFLMWKFHVDDPSKGKYDTISGRDLLTELVLNLRLSGSSTIQIMGLFNGLQ